MTAYRPFTITFLPLLASAALAGCDVRAAKVDSAVPPEPGALPVDTVAPSRGDVYASYAATGILAADADAPVIARVAGEVVTIAVEEGGRVSKGQLLARLDGERLRLRMREQAARLDLSRREFDRLARLHAKGLVSRAARDRAEFELEALDATYRLTRLDYEYTAIRAPIDGIVSARYVKTGQAVGAGAAVFHVTDTRRLVTELLVPQAELLRITPGDTASVLVDALPGEVFEASIARVSPTIDPVTGTFRATAYVDNRDGRLAPGMFGRFDIAFEKHVNALLIPGHAILREDGEDVVFVVDGDTAERRPVSLGIEDGGMVEILGGLQEGEAVVVSGQGNLRDGARVLARGAGTAATAG